VCDQSEHQANQATKKAEQQVDPQGIQSSSNPSISKPSSNGPSSKQAGPSKQASGSKQIKRQGIGSSNKASTKQFEHGSN
jgi:hypothetical protein